MTALPRIRLRGLLPALLVAAGMAHSMVRAAAQDPAPSSPPSPNEPGRPSEPTVEDRLRSQDEMIRQLAEQNRRLSEQLEALTRRLDGLKPGEEEAEPAEPAPDAAPPPPGAGEPVAPPQPAPTRPPLDRDEYDKYEPPSRKPDPGVGAGAPPRLSSGPPRHFDKGLFDSLHHDDDYGFKSLFDSLHPEGRKSAPWYEKLSLRGYTQFRFGRTLDQTGDVFLLGNQDPEGADPFLLGDRSVNGNAENFTIRRARLILFGDISDHLYLYFQPDFANTPPASPGATFFAQLRDLYGDVYITKNKVHRARVGLSKIPYGWENMQSSQNRIPLDRTDPINTGASPNERDLGVFYYWTPVEKQKLLRELVDGGLRGSGNYGILGLGVYNGQGGSQVERNLNLHSIARFTWPFRLANGQVVEASIQGYTGEYVVQGAEIRPYGRGEPITPENTGGNHGLRDQRLGGTFVWYPQPFGFQSEWNFGEGPGLNEAQTAVEVRPLQGGYVMAMYKYDSPQRGIFTPYVRYQSYRGGYRSINNAPFGNHDQWDLGVEWQLRREMELTCEYTFVNGVNLNPINELGNAPYRNFNGDVLRFQFQINY
jgi:hypothetical protein